MKLFLVLMLCGLAAAAPNFEQPISGQLDSEVHPNNWIIDQAVNALIRQLFGVIRLIIQNGSEPFGIPVLDPLQIEEFSINVPAGLINLELDLEKVLAVGVSGFEVHRSRLDLNDLSFDLEISVPSVDISAEQYDFVGDLFTAIPLYGKGRAVFQVEGLRFQLKIFLKQSEDGQSVIIDRVVDPSFVVPSFKSRLTGVIGGGNIDAVVNAVIEEVIVDYVNRFQGYISMLVARILPPVANPILEQLDTWRFLAPLVRP